MLFPIQWNEPFGLVMIEAMAAGTPVLALPGGAVQRGGCRRQYPDTCVPHLDGAGGESAPRRRPFNPLLVRRYVEENFSVERMVEKYAALYREMPGRRHGTCRLYAKRWNQLMPEAIEQLPAEPEEPRAIA